VDLVVTNGNFLLTSGIFKGALSIDQGRIVKIGKENKLPNADKRLDLHGLLVFPGVIDAHVHFWDPGFTYREDWESGTKSAAAGGVTTVVDHAYSNQPPTFTLENMKSKRIIAEKKAVVDFAFYAGGTRETFGELSKLMDAGCVGAKFFMSEFCHSDDSSLLEAFSLLSKKNRLALVHAENYGIVTSLKQALINEGRKEPEIYPRSRPSLAEEEATFRAISLARVAGCAVYIVHSSTPTALRHVRAAKLGRHRVFAETCPQYLLLDDSLYRRQGPYACMNPPLRSKKEVLEMWRYVNDGTIDVIATDHAPYPKSEKEPGWQDIWQAAPGAPGVETMLPLLLDQVKKGSLTMSRLARMLCYNPSRILGLYPRKGIIAPGSDADLTIIDIRKTARISSHSMHTKGEFTLFEGRKVRGVPVKAMVRGNLVMDNGYPGEIVARSGTGCYLPAS